MARRIKTFIQKQISNYRLNNSLHGEWELFEYYYDSKNILQHVEKDQLKSEGNFWELSFLEPGILKMNVRLPVQSVNGLYANKWSRKRNYVAFADEELGKNAISFQYSIDKGILKLLKKDKSGKIEIFAFFERIDDKKRRQQNEASMNVVITYLFFGMTRFNITPTTAPRPIPAKEKFPH